MLVLRKFVSTINSINAWIGDKTSYLVFGIFLLILFNVILRYLFKFPTVWASELSEMLFACYAVLIGGYILHIDGHVNVDLLYSHFSTKTKALVNILTVIPFFAFCGVLFIYGGSMALDSVLRLETSHSAWDPPLYPIRLMIPLSALLLFLQGLAKLIVDFFVVFGIDNHESKDNIAKEEPI